MLRCCADHTGFNILDARATAINRHDQNIFFTPHRLQCFISASCGRFIDGVDDIDGRIFLEKIFHGATATFFITIGKVATYDTWIIFIAELSLVLRVNAEAYRETLIAQNVDAWL
ncbi:hypothetical protein D9M70_590260 [compost metagenome]